LTLISFESTNLQNNDTHIILENIKVQNENKVCNSVINTILFVYVFYCFTVKRQTDERINRINIDKK